MTEKSHPENPSNKIPPTSLQESNTLTRFVKQPIKPEAETGKKTGNPSSGSSMPPPPPPPSTTIAQEGTRIIPRGGNQSMPPMPPPPSTTIAQEGTRIIPRGGNQSMPPMPPPPSTTIAQEGTRIIPRGGNQSMPPMPPPPPSDAMPLSGMLTGESMLTGEMGEQTFETMPILPKDRVMSPREAGVGGAPPPPSFAPGRSLDRESPRPILRPSPGHPTLESLVQEAYTNDCSDIHLGVNEIPRMRERGEIVITNHPVTDHHTFMSWLREVLTEEQIQQYHKNLEYDGATQYEFARVRINIFDSLRGPGMVLRLIPVKILTIEQLRLPPVFKDISDYHKGLVLVTGPTGSGKSTTLAAMVDYINNEHPKHIISIEDPIEFVHQSRKSIIRQREVGIHTYEFDRALKASLREDPDVILVGEMRDRETVNTALKAAQTGHLVMGTLHTNSAVKTLERMLSLYSPEEQDAMRMAISESLVAVISQGLCRTTDGKRAAFHDILINTETVKDYVKQCKYEEITQLMQNGEYDGMITMNQSLFNLYQEGRITEEVALEMSPVPNEMAMMLRGRI